MIEKTTVASYPDDSHYNEIKSLSEEILSLRERLSTTNSELSAMKGRLSVAKDRIAKYEATEQERKPADNDDIENNSYKGFSRDVRQRNNKLKQQFPAMREALQLESVLGSRRDNIGKVLDGLDAFLVSSGKFLRFNPVARLLFILYLIILHTWTFILIIVHAHGIEKIHGDFGAGGTIATGPHALMQPVTNESLP